MQKLIRTVLFFYSSCFILSCDPQKKKVTYARIIRDAPVTKKINYSDGSLHLIITYQHGSLSQIEYFNHSGKYDSIAYYKRGQKNGVTHFKYDENSNIEKLNFTNGLLTSTQRFDSANNLLYKEPIFSNKIAHTQFLLKSGRNYINKTLIDTLYIINKDLPVLNRAFRFINFLPKRIGTTNISEYRVNPASIRSGANNLMILVYLHQQNDRQQLLDTLNIPVH